MQKHLWCPVKGAVQSSSETEEKFVCASIIFWETNETAEEVRREQSEAPAMPVFV